MLEKLKREVLKANLELKNNGLVILTWGNVSGIDRNKNLIVIKPSGVEYGELKDKDMVVVDLNGKVIEGDKNPSTDTPAHLELYKAFPGIGGIAHAHSMYAVMFAQAGMEIPCFGTTHADHFHGPVPLTRFLSKEEVKDSYELNTGRIIVERFKKLDPLSVPGVLVRGHAPFAWGKNAADSVRNALILEKISEMAFGTLTINPDAGELPKYISNKHFQRKHGGNSYYGQKITRGR